MDIKQINQAIMFGQFDNTQLNSIIDAVKWARSNLTQQKKRELTIGSEVKFTSTKRGMVIHGQVVKIAQKYVTVKTMTEQWRVPANMLEIA